MADPRIYQGSPPAEVPLDWYKRRSGDDDSDMARARARATEVAPGVFVGCLGWGRFIMPDGTFSDGARIAVWEVQAAQSADAAASSACGGSPRTPRQQ